MPTEGFIKYQPEDMNVPARLSVEELIKDWSVREKDAHLKAEQLTNVLRSVREECRITEAVLQSLRQILEESSSDAIKEHGGTVAYDTRQ